MGFLRVVVVMAGLREAMKDRKIYVIHTVLNITRAKKAYWRQGCARV